MLLLRNNLKTPPSTKKEGNQKIKDTNQEESGCGYIEVDFKVKKSGRISDNDQCVNASRRHTSKCLYTPPKSFKCTQQNMTEFKGEVDKSITKVEKFNTPLSD